MIMCGITGAFNRENAFEVVSSSLNVIKERGRDGTGIYDSENIEHVKKVSDLNKVNSKNVIGHVLHAIVNTVSQPIKDDEGVLVANCEIYNWKELNDKYNLDAENDSVLLLKLLNKFGVEKTVLMLHGVYAFCYWNCDDVFLARDIIGIKPLWFSQDSGLIFVLKEKVLLIILKIFLN